jgi:hypothetical protein
MAKQIKKKNYRITTFIDFEKPIKIGVRRGSSLEGSGVILNFNDLNTSFKRYSIPKGAKCLLDLKKHGTVEFNFNRVDILTLHKKLSQLPKDFKYPSTTGSKTYEEVLSATLIWGENEN